MSAQRVKRNETKREEREEQAKKHPSGDILKNCVCERLASLPIPERALNFNFQSENGAFRLTTSKEPSSQRPVSKKGTASIHFSVQSIYSGRFSSISYWRDKPVPPYTLPSLHRSFLYSPSRFWPPYGTQSGCRVQKGRIPVKDDGIHHNFCPSDSSCSPRICKDKPL